MVQQERRILAAVAAVLKEPAAQRAVKAVLVL
jgi:hypothetical protein